MPGRPRHLLRGAPSAALALALFAAVFSAGSAVCGPVVGFVETWPGVSLQGWTGGSALLNPGTGGVGGAGDGFLRVATGFPAHLGTVSFSSSYAGNWVSAGVTRVRVWLNAVEDIQPTEAAAEAVAEPLEIHFSLGNGGNFWQYNVGFVPPSRAWAPFIVDLSNPAAFTRIIGSGTFQQALMAVDRVHLRHDRAPFVQTPDPVQGVFGVDNFELANEVTDVPPASWGRVKALYRR